MNVVGIYLAHGQGHHPFSPLPTWVGTEHSWTKPSCWHPHLLDQVALEEVGQELQNASNSPKVLLENHYTSTRIEQHCSGTLPSPRRRKTSPMVQAKATCRH